MNLKGLLIATSVAFLAACSEKRNEPSAEASAEEKSGPPSRVQQLSGGKLLVTLDSATQKIMGLQVAHLERAQLNPELKGYGRVLDISPLASLAAELATAQAASAASEAELKRLKTLAAQSNTSERALQSAEATAVRDRAQVESTRLRLLANWGQAISERPDLTGFVQRLGSLESALVEVDVPAGEQPKEAPAGARLFALGNENKPVEAQFLGPTPVVGSMQGHGYLFLVDPNVLRLTPGAAVSGFLLLPGSPRTGELVPRSAVIRFNGASWVYLQTGEETFQRTEVQLEEPLQDGWFVRHSLKPQDKVVVVGAQQLLSQELKGQALE